MDDTVCGWLERWPDDIDLDNKKETSIFLAEINVSEERLRRAIASVGTDIRPVAAYLLAEDMEFGPDANTIAATGRRSADAEAVGPRWRNLPNPPQLIWD